MPKSKSEVWQEWWHEYAATVPEDKRTTRDLALWAMQNKGADIPFEKRLAHLTKDAQDALKAEQTITPSGKQMRRNVCAPAEVLDSETGKIKQLMLWGDVRDSNRINFLIRAAYHNRRLVGYDMKAQNNLVQGLCELHPPIAAELQGALFPIPDDLHDEPAAEVS